MPNNDGTGRLGKGKNCNTKAKKDRMNGRNKKERNPKKS